MAPLGAVSHRFNFNFNVLCTSAWCTGLDTPSTPPYLVRFASGGSYSLKLLCWSMYCKYRGREMASIGAQKQNTVTPCSSKEYKCSDRENSKSRRTRWRSSSSREYCHMFWIHVSRFRLCSQSFSDILSPISCEMSPENYLQNRTRILESNSNVLLSKHCPNLFL